MSDLTQQGKGDQTPIVVRPLTFEEQTSIQAYSEAIKTALSTAAEANTTIVTASFSLAAAYGALVGLVTPQGDQPTIVVALPFVPLGLGFLAGMVGRVRGISLDVVASTDDVRSKVKSAVEKQRFWSRIGAAAFMVAVITAGVVVAVNYGGTKSASTVHVHARLSTGGSALVRAACGKTVHMLLGDAKTSPLRSATLDIQPDRGMPCSGGHVEMPVADIVALTTD